MTQRKTTPRQARRFFLKSKAETVRESSKRVYEYPTKHFCQFLESEGVESMTEVDGYLFQRWSDKRGNEDIAPATYRSSVKHVKTFIGYCKRNELVEPTLFDKIEIPSIPDEAKSSSEIIRHPMYQDVSRYLEITQYASVYHVMFELIWETGCRISGAQAIDVGDFHPTKNMLEFRNRERAGTPLKNDNKSERNVTITDDLIGIITDYIEVIRPDITDEHRRQPLLTTEHGRLTRQRAYKNMKGFTRHCVYSSGCPHNRDIDTCEAAQKKKKAYDCPSTQSTHPLRRGSITHHLNRGVPKETVSERCDVGLDVLDRHYNEQTREDEREQRQKYIRDL